MWSLKLQVSDVSKSSKPQANYFVLPSAQKMYESAFGGEPPKPSAASLALPPSPSFGAPPAVPARGAPPALPSGGPPSSSPSPSLAASSGGDAAGAAAGKSKQCQRCQTSKAASKVTIQGTPLKLCQSCADLVSTNQDVARETVRMLGLAVPSPSAAAPSGPPQMCDQCSQRPQHARTVVGGTLKTLCAACMADTPHFISLTRYALACVATKNIDEAKASFEELLHISPEHPPTLYNCACVQALQNELESSLRLLGRALDAGYDNIKQIKKGKEEKKYNNRILLFCLLRSHEKKKKKKKQFFFFFFFFFKIRI